jgi:FkbH-like protein
MDHKELQQSLSEALEKRDSRSVQILLRRMFQSEPSLTNAQSVLKHSTEANFSIPKEPFKVAFLRAFTVEPLLPVMKAAALVGGINLQIEIGNFNTYNQEILDRESWLYKYQPKLIIFALQCRDVLPEIWQKASELSEADMRALVQSALDDVRTKLSTIRTQLNSAILLPTLDTPLYSAEGILDSQMAYCQQSAIEAFNQGLKEIARANASVYVIDVKELVSRFGKAKWYDERKWHLARLPFSAEAIPELAMEYMKFIHVLSGKLAKVIVVDLDNTLWGGVIGEDGMEGIKVGASSRGHAFQEFQRTLLDCYQRGILLAICSKNNLADAMEVLEKHPEMLLRPQHFAALRINWVDKAQNLKEIAEELSLGLDSIAFLDDNPVERQRVATEVPEIQVIEMPVDPAQYASAVRQCLFFERLSLSSEDKERGRYYAEERQRRDVQSSATSIEDFYRSLAMEAEVAEADPQSLARIAQLTQKTNQFNLTTRRYSEQEIAELKRSPQCRVYFLKSRDRFGDNGIVGVAISKMKGDICEIDTFLMSCRVIGRTLENAMLSQIAQDARGAGARQIEGWFVPTAKNAPAKDFYTSSGFSAVENGEDGRILWRCDINQDKLEWPEWVTKLSGELQKA